jgi:catechol 2,3-dioxygenase-like lactoylglutathione lyase family enzyme
MTPAIVNLVETGVYVDDLDRGERFYGEVLGLKPIGREPGRHAFFRVGREDVLLLFRAAETLKSDLLPPHGTTGPSHFALGIPAEGLEAWRERLEGYGVAIEKEVDWPNGGRSIYFRDPSGNSVELITPGVWGLPSGW